MSTTQAQVSPGLWALAWRRLRADKVAMTALGIVIAFLITLALSATGLIAADWEQEIAVSYAPPSFIGADGAGAGKAEAEAPPPENPLDPLKDIIRELRKQPGGAAQAPVNDYGIADPLAKEMAEINADLAKTGKAAVLEKQTTLPFGADKWGHDIIKKTVKGAETSIVVGLVAAFLATLLGTVFGASAGYFGGRVDDFFNWFYSIFTSIPYLLLILAVAAVLQQKGITTIILILAFTGWTGPFRLIRAEYMKHKAREYVWAADAIGASHWRKMFVHIFPNVSHVALVQISILVVGFIKSEVILSFLGFGVPVGVVSWGSMLNEAQNELILGKWWQLVAATAAMAVLVTAFSLFTDALRDALDPKLK
ncbi:ABC transporter permease [Undibacterium sp. TJN25]|uniref:ABC transporter permease n=1 Tax=Undibacterium sp. TJN25 TaxID=3413056 RepID=UPI003BF3AAF6